MKRFDSWGYVLAVALFGCGSGSGGGEGAAGAGGTGSSEACAAIASDCMSQQRVCRETTGTAACELCPEGEIPISGTECSPIPGTVMSHDFGPTRMEPGFEDDDVCQAWTLNNDEAIFYRGVELLNGGGYHHSNWFFVPEQLPPEAGDPAWTSQPDGAWPCRASDFTELQAAAFGGVLFAQATQSVQEAQLFNEGVGVKIPPRSRIIGWTHVFNTTAEPIDSDLELRIYEVAEAEVMTQLQPFRLNISDIQIPARKEVELTGHCDFGTPQMENYGIPFEMNLHYVMPHYHALGTGFRLAALGGPNDGVPFFELDGSEPIGRTFPEPVSLAGSQGFSFTCKYTNPRDEDVHFGIGDQEMCVMLGFGDKPFLYDGNVTQSERVDDGSGAARYEGDCTVIAGPLPEGR